MEKSRFGGPGHFEKRETALLVARQEALKAKMKLGMASTIIATIAVGIAVACLSRGGKRRS